MAILLGSNCKEMMMMMMMMKQFSMLMLMMSLAALIHSQNVYFFCRYFHICSSSFASLQISGIIRESRDIRDLQNFHYFWHFWSGVDTECNNISGNHILCTHLSIHNLLWRFQAVQYHKSLSWANITTIVLLRVVIWLLVVAIGLASTSSTKT
jgi:hypothetical protein